ncbi:hypothetical protein [Nocardiopsis sp. CNR-923]|nr:hypothetical protein [Nocardiopsis sp. CNR-923]
MSLISNNPWRSATRPASTSNIEANTSRSPILGSASAHSIGIPEGAQTR